jgi:hypothetical protein
MRAMRALIGPEWFMHRDLTAPDGRRLQPMT